MPSNERSFTVDASVISSPTYSFLSAWAEQNGCLVLVNSLYTVLGLDKDEPGITNFVTELGFVESRKILKQWEGLPLVHHFQGLAECFSTFEYAPIYKREHQGSAYNTKKSFSNLKGRDFLLAMLVNPLTVAIGGDVSGEVSAEIFMYRRKLRLWLVIEALLRFTQKNIPLDSNISTASRRLVMGANSSDWHFVDSLIKKVAASLKSKPESFTNFKNALGVAVEQQLNEPSITRKATIFYNSIRGICLGQDNPIELGYSAGSFSSKVFQPSFLTFSPVSTSDTLANEFGFSFEASDQQSNAENAIQLDINYPDEDGESDLLVASVEAGTSFSEKADLANSIYLQTAEASHFLPWSLHAPLPPEIPQLNNWLNTRLVAKDVKTALGAALCWLAAKLGRSLYLVRQLKISELAETDWTISTDFQQVRRRSIHRLNAWKPKESQEDLVEGFTQDFKIEISAVTNALKQAAQGKQFYTLGALWDFTEPDQKLGNWLKVNLPLSLERINSTQIFNLLKNEVFQRTGDHHLARLLPSHPQEGLPGAVSYASWDLTAIEKGLALKPVPSGRPSLKVAGSLLTPIEMQLCEKIEAANKQLLVKEVDLIQWHNTFAQYVVWALYAATGSRYLADPYEKLNHFNLELGIVFINDKNDAGLHSGRLTPLADKAVRLVKSYLAHLQNLAAQLTEPFVPLANQIAALANAKPAQLPLFFLLDEKLNWQSMSNHTNLENSLIDWELPLNLFRHRFSQKMYRAGVELEVIDGWLGHAERGVASYSDYSPRCWMDDKHKYLDLINAVFNSLPFVEPDIKDTYPLKLNQKLLQSWALGQQKRDYGQRLRERKRRARIKQAIAEADQLIKGLEFDEQKKLQEESLNRVIQQLLKNANGMAHPHAALRFKKLVDFLQQEDTEYQLNIRTYAHYLKPEQSLMRSRVVKDLNLVQELSEWAHEKLQSKLDKLPTKADSLVIATCLFAIAKRVSYLRLLTDLAQGQHYRLVQHKKTFFLEYSETLEPNQLDTPIQRHRINQRLASLLNHGKAIKRPTDLASKPPVELQELVSLLGLESNTNIEQLLKEICITLEQANLVEMPGMVAATLSERCPSTSLPLLDYVRLEEGQPKTWPGPLKNENIKKSLDSFDGFGLGGVNLEKDKQLLFNEAKQFRNEMAGIINQYTTAQAKTIAKNIEALVTKKSSQLSNSLILLGYWLAELIQKGKAPGKRKKFSPFAMNSIKAYFGSLIVPFTELAYDLDILILNSEELTELYEKMIELRSEQGHRLDYFSKRLMTFQRWAETKGVVTPDYTDLRIADDSRTVSAGLVTEKDYLSALALIDNQYIRSNTHPELGLMLSFVLLLTYRFGLRSKEATYLRFNDFCEYQGIRWVLVRNNQKRQLKTTSSRRAVPLIFPITRHENTVIKRILDRYSNLAGNQANELILSDLISTKLVPSDYIQLIPAELIKVLRAVTGNQRLVLHHCRHSFYPENRKAPSFMAEI